MLGCRLEDMTARAAQLQEELATATSAWSALSRSAEVAVVASRPAGKQE